MKKNIDTTYTLTEADIKEAVRRYLVEIIGTKEPFSEKDIKLEASVDENESPYDFTATLTISTESKITKK